ncbi:hypothetical protein DM02DRAFT_655440 [Periconia macrospinosa]|uniref:UBA domain-containing protein n=1 Tax=Periconia macrospinosa TaxID=97972 RepID=A0A2V1DTB9_9PLEO|nr:hypothetical protein DM02DRAFT_655440 [Periconia macrospinosa]
MDDLAGLDWSASSKPQPSTTPSALPPFRQNPTPQLSGRSTPLSAQQSGAGAISAGSRNFKAPSKPATPANDSFASLVSLNTSKPATSNLSLQERQKQLQEEKARQEAQRNKQYDNHYGTDTKFWDSLGSGKSTPEPAAATSIQRPSSMNPGGQTLSQTINKPFSGLDTSSKRPMKSPPADDDLLSAFNSAAPVDASSHFPPPSVGSGRSTPAYGAQRSRGHTPAPPASNPFVNDDDDDMFGLKQLAQKPVNTSVSTAAPDNGDDDILGLLGKPVSEFEKKPEPTPVVETDDRESGRHSTPAAQSPHDRAVAELVDMGFPPDKSAIALATTESGHDVQGAVGWLLNQAHAEAKSKTEERSQDRSRRAADEPMERSRRGNGTTGRGTREPSAGGSMPAWMRADEERSRSGQRRADGQAQEKDVSQIANELGSTFLKSANSFWKTSQKKVQKAVAEFQQDGGDPNVPKWMRDAQNGSDANKARGKAPSSTATDEAMMLEAGGRPTKPNKPSRNRQEPDPLPVRPRRDGDGFREQSPSNLPNRMSSQSPAFRQKASELDKRPASKLTRHDLEEQSTQAYVSPARRKKTTPQPQPDLFATDQPAPAASASRQATPVRSNNPFLQAASTPKPRSPAVTATPPKPKAPPRQIPPASSSALNSSASYRQKGSDAFKRGDYAAAHSAYSSALGPLPQTHPVAIIVLCNRAVTNIKIGDPKAAVVDTDAALGIIGISKGEGEKIVLGGAEGDKEMKDFYGKALMRKAEALEHMEKWADAGKVWREAVEAGVGGSISIQGRNRCEKAVGGGNQASAPAQTKRPPVRKPAPPKPTAISDLGGSSNADSEAVKRLKAANIAAEKADDEKFALSDQVDAKLVAWRGTKADNLRALLGSLDKVLWPEAGWNKVNMGDLVMPNKVKIIYMKAIAKVHPDKISQTATTEQRMISAAVFASLNEAWDKFKKDNGICIKSRRYSARYNTDYVIGRMFPPSQGLRLDVDAISQICGSVSIACWIVVFSPQIIENWKRSSADGLSVVFIIIWLLGDFFNIFGAVLQGVLPTMTILAVYYTLADIVLLSQCFWYKGFTLKDEVKSSDDESSEEETENSPLLSNTRQNTDGAPINGNGNNNGYHSFPRGDGIQTPPTISDIDRRHSSSQHSFRERFLSIDGTHLSPVTPLIDTESEAGGRPKTSRQLPSQSTIQNIAFNLGTILLVCAAGVLGWFLSTTRSRDTNQPPENPPSSSPLHFNLWGQIFGYICTFLYLGSRVPQLLLNYRRKSTDGISMLFFLFACIGNLTYVLSIVAYKPVCKIPENCEPGEASRIYGRYIAVNLSWLLGSFGTLVLDAFVFVQYFLYRRDDESEYEDDTDEE